MIDGRWDVVGAAGPRRFFEALAPSQLSHAYGFTGSAGVGKKTFARRLAQSLLCERPKTTLLGYCGECRSCIGVQSGTHPDLYLHVGSLKIGDRGAAAFADEDATARTLVRQLGMHSYAGGRRIFILGDVEFTREAANALLKFFEEPPPGVLLLVTTPSPGRLLATIRSRMIELVFPLLRPAEIAEILIGEGTSAEDATRVAALAQGSVAHARAIAGDADEGVRSAVVTWYLDSAAGRAADGAWVNRANLDDGLEIAKVLTRDRLALALGGVPLLAPDVGDRIANLPRVEPSALVRMLAAIGDAQRTAGTNVTPEFVAQSVRMALATLR